MASGENAQDNNNQETLGPLSSEDGGRLSLPGRQLQGMAIEPRPLRIGMGPSRTEATSPGSPGEEEDIDKSRGSEDPAMRDAGRTMTAAEGEGDLWLKLERTMSSRQDQVLSVLEDFGIADVAPESDALEEQVWRVVQGEITFQEAVDLV